VCFIAAFKKSRFPNPAAVVFKRRVTDRCQHGVGTMRDGLMGNRV
jgi:hypothetical protein